MKQSLTVKSKQTLNLNFYPIRALKKLIATDDPQIVPFQLALMDCFATHNGWEVSGRGFSFSCLAARRDLRDGRPIGLGGVRDHAVWFREIDKPHLPAALALQPYDHRTYDEEIHAIERAYDLVAHRPRVSTNSLYYPGRCFIFLFTRHGIPLRWLPEQL